MRGEQAENIRQLLQRIKEMPSVELEVQADQLLAGSVSGVDLAAAPFIGAALQVRSEEHTSELQSRGHLVCRLLLEKKNNKSNRVSVDISEINTKRRRVSW